MERLSHGLRRAALDKLAGLSVKEAPSTSQKSGLDRLLKETGGSQRFANGKANGMGNAGPEVSQISMSLRELEVLLALCKAAPSIQTLDSAEKLLDQLSPYLIESYCQKITNSPFFRDIEPSPWEFLTQSLTSAVLALGLNFPGLRAVVSDTLNTYLHNALSVSQAEFGEENSLELATLVVSFLGFLEASSTYAKFWSTTERLSLSLISQVRRVLSDQFLVNVETAFSAIQNSQDVHARSWRRYVRHYDAEGRPLGAMLLGKGFMKLLMSSTSILISDAVAIKGEDILDVLMSDQSLEGAAASGDLPMIEACADMATEEHARIEDGADYARMGSDWQQKLAYCVKAYALTIFCNCVILNDAVADPGLLYQWLTTTMTDPVQMADETLAGVTLKILAILSKNDGEAAASYISSLHRFVVEGVPSKFTVKVISNCLSYILRYLPQDATITTLNTLGHVLSSTNPERALKAERLQPFDQQTMGSTLSLASNLENDKLHVYSNVIDVVIGVASGCKDEKMISLAQSILLQRLNKVNGSVTARILTGAYQLSFIAASSDFKALLQTYNKTSIEAAWSNDENIANAILEARVAIAKKVARDSPLYDIYLGDILEAIVFVGEPQEGGRQFDMVLATRQISQLLTPLSILLSHNITEKNFAPRYGFMSLLRDFWLNLAVHGFTYGSDLAKPFANELRIIAKYTPPLVSGVKDDEKLDGDFEQHIILKRSNNLQNSIEHKKRLTNMIPTNEVDIRVLTYARTVFLESVFTLECFRSEAGACSQVLAYFVESGFKMGDHSGSMNAISIRVLDIYIGRILSGQFPEFSAAQVGDQLAEIFIGCCHRIEKVQDVAVNIADRIMAIVPPALCQKAPLFAMLELLTLMWVSCLEEDMDEYATRSLFTSPRGKVSIEMPDSFGFRKKTLKGFHMKCKGWVQKVLNIAPLDVKGLLQTYLAECEDEATFGHVSLGRSFALEMGGAIPQSDQRLASIDHLRDGDCNANIASDFIVQYTRRQAYRNTDPAYLEYQQQDLLHLKSKDAKPNSTGSIDPAQVFLSQLENRNYKDFVSINELRDVLRTTAAYVCRSEKIQGELLHQLVAIPFAVFSKASIKLGISLWTGVMHENPRLQPRLLAEIARNFEITVERKMGLFSSLFVASDAFDLKMDYSPSDKEQLLLEQQQALALLCPHLKLIQFFSSHYHAHRHGDPQIQKIFLRLVRISLQGLKTATGHPLAREARFQLVLLGLHVLKFTAGFTEKQEWKLKDLILSAALSWFKFPPRWSFGGNRLQVKAEAHIMQDVANFLQTISNVGGNIKNLRLKQELLLLLVENEMTRLATWLYPLDHSRKHHLVPTYNARPPTDNSVALVLQTAWHESPALALQLVRRFQSPRLEADVKRLISMYPEKVVDLPEALQIMLGDKISNNLGPQLKYLLYWAPVSPITATTYFLPAYMNNAFILQYAMRALESHSVDVTFFYVPQIVQTLRYDDLGYVARFILETAKFSQLFAHQIIWNMKANAFKDEESQIPDPVKPTLDKVMERLIDSFSGADKSFYEREFSFFGEVTSISGKLRPYIKKTKPEKNAKIAEELAKIKVDVGVYLPSNPDGVVVDIDRKSGKSLQSHAKAPFMATFRIKKKPISSAETYDNHHKRGESVSTVTKELWQSAIFKVGDDCRQDMLALQLISAFRSIFNTVGLDVYVYPYRVTATAPGCGVIDVLPKSISRDMLGRDYEMGLYDYFINKYGGEDSIKFQEARANFVKSMAAYSVISYLLKFKDRHNGNIMIDDAGHILHIDFGFIFDIAPGGITFERAPFKLTAEMISVMGGSTDSQPYQWFEELCIKSFLACRPYVDKLCHCIILMMDSGLPCFKPETIQNFRDRLVLDKNEREAADYMRYLIKKSYGSYSTGQYDRFQHLTNGIPY
ncbi:Phosphatidylinositol 4-kinase stt4 [Rhizina undulata]